MALALAISPAVAQQVIFIDDAQTTTNGGATIDGDDQITVTESGSITVSGAGEDGIFADGANNVILVDGVVRTQGPGSGAGIDSAGADARITINGSVIADVPFGEAIIIRGADTIVVNNGTIVSGDSQGVDFRAVALNAVLVNTGTIVTTEEGDQAVNFAERGTVINSGLILTSSFRTESVQMAGGGILQNSGSIIATGGEAQAVEVRDGTVLSNTGRIISERGDAILVSNNSDTDDTINLLAPGFIGGIINFGTRDTAGTQTTVNVVTGPSQSIFWTLDGVIGDGVPNTSGSVPWFYNAATQSVATFDPTLLASQSNALGDLTSLLSRAGLGAVQGFGSGSRSDTGFSALGFMPVDDGAAVAQRLGRAWATVLGGQMDHEGGAATLDSTIAHFGFAGGFTWQHMPETTLSAMAGYVMGNMEADATWSPSFDHETHTLFASLYGEHQLDWAALQFGLTTGYSRVDHNRFVNDNLAPLGESWVSADYGGFFLSPELALSTDISFADGTIFTPNAGLRYAAQWLDGYTEAGAFSPAANATVEDRFIGTLEARVGLDVTRSFALGTLTGRIGYLGRWSTGDDGANITLNGVTQTVASDVQNLNAVTVGATLRSALGETAFLELDANYLLGDTAQGFDGQITVGLAF